MKDKYGVPKGVRLTEENCERLERAKELGLSFQKTINEMLEMYFGDYMAKKAKGFRSVSDAPGQ